MTRARASARGDAGGVDGDPAAPPLLGDVRRGAGAAGGVQEEVAGVGGHQDATLWNKPLSCLHDINLCLVLHLQPCRSRTSRHRCLDWEATRAKSERNRLYIKVWPIGLRRVAATQRPIPLAFVFHPPFFGRNESPSSSNRKCGSELQPSDSSDYLPQIYLLE